MIAAAVKTYEAKQLAEAVDYTWSLGDLIVWCSIEYNLLIVCASVPLIRPLFQRRGRQHPYIQPEYIPEEHELSTKPSNEKKYRVKSAASSVGSEEYIMPTSSRVNTLPPMGSISRTVEVQVSYESANAPVVHAALVGLLQGEMMNPELVRR